MQPQAQGKGTMFLFLPGYRSGDFGKNSGFATCKYVWFEIKTPLQFLHLQNGKE